jgi:hypothetical protein
MLVSTERGLSALRRIQIPSELYNLDALNSFGRGFHQNDIYLGLGQWKFCIIGPLLLLAAIGTCATICAMASLALKLLTLVVPKNQSINQKPELGRRLIAVCILSLLVIFSIPYQLAFIAATIVQIFNTVRTRFDQNFYNYNLSLSILFLLISGINGPIIVVWVHNLALNWTVPFTSHHNVLSVLPVLLLVENITHNNMIPRLHKTQRLATLVFLSYIAFYAILYGFLHTFLLHHLVNAFALWLLVIYLEDPGTTNRVTNLLKKTKA